MNLEGMEVLVVGLARTGTAAARFLSRRGARVVGTDVRNRGDLERESPELKDLDVELRVGESQAEESFLRAELIVLSPGVPPSIRPIVEARRRGIPVVGEIELASWFITIPIVAVTGTNGKTTTTLLIGEMLKRAGRRIFVGGNVGNPLINLAGDEGDREIAVVELSSFQLETIGRFRPALAVLLNITEDHLDRYTSFDSYLEAKSRLFINQEETDVSILNWEDRLVKRAASACRARKLFFNLPGGESEGAFFDGERIVVRGIEGEEVYYPGRSGLVGGHNRENMMAAILSARLYGCPRDAVQTALEEFEGLPHRLEFVRETGGVRYFNDSKATNVGAAVKSLQAFSGPVILIAGGRDKGGDYAPLKGPILERVEHLILIGEAADRMERELGAVAKIIRAESLEEAVGEAHLLARPGDTVLLSPACSSYDMFRDYEERGEVFKALVKRLGGPAKTGGSGAAREKNRRAETSPT
ncbi:MAG: UDP-N-acetylmuramoyl-L-alanine--D-glutamate ligase [Deltaproteobacteria bacterium]|nr:UDP-N-acetylmuramoyl-L-alanine--D-glutamate ligase [Deltaproteobacteria bacterium]